MVDGKQENLSHLRRKKLLRFIFKNRFTAAGGNGRRHHHGAGHVSGKAAARKYRTAAKKHKCREGVQCFQREAPRKVTDFHRKYCPAVSAAPKTDIVCNRMFSISDYDHEGSYEPGRQPPPDGSNLQTSNGPEWWRIRFQLQRENGIQVIPTRSDCLRFNTGQIPNPMNPERLADTPWHGGQAGWLSNTLRRKG